MHRTGRSLRSAAAALGLFLAAAGPIGCAPSGKLMVDPASPIRVGADREIAHTVAFSTIISSISPDDEIGGEHQGYLHIKYGSIQGSRITEALPYMRSAVEEELRQAGYRVVANERPVSPFDQRDAAAPEGDFMIGGTISACRYNTYNTFGENCKCEADVKWQVLDRGANAIVYEMQSKGIAKGPGDKAEVIALAVAGSLREVLADQRFADLVTKR